MKAGPVSEEAASGGDDGWVSAECRLCRSPPRTLKKKLINLRVFLLALYSFYFYSCVINTSSYFQQINGYSFFLFSFFYWLAGVTTACLRIFPKKPNIFLPHRESCCSHLQESVSGRRSGWLTPRLSAAPEPPDVFGRRWRCIRWRHVTPPRPHTPAISHVTVGLFFSNLDKVSIQSDFRLGASCFIFFRPQKLAKKREKNPATRITIVNKMHEILNVTAAVFQAGDSCAATVDAAGPSSVKVRPPAGRLKIHQRDSRVTQQPFHTSFKKNSLNFVSLTFLDVGSWRDAAEFRPGTPTLAAAQRFSGRREERNLCRTRENSLPWVAFAQPWILSWKCFLLWKRLQAAWKMTSLVSLTVFLQKSATFYAVLGPRPNLTWCSETIFLLASHKFERFAS